MLFKFFDGKRMKRCTMQQLLAENNKALASAVCLKGIGLTDKEKQALYEGDLLSLSVAAIADKARFQQFAIGQTMIEKDLDEIWLLLKPNGFNQTEYELVFKKNGAFVTRQMMEGNQTEEDDSDCHFIASNGLSFIQLLLSMGMTLKGNLLTHPALWPFEKEGYLFLS